MCFTSITGYILKIVNKLQCAKCTTTLIDIKSDADHLSCKNDMSYKSCFEHVNRGGFCRASDDTFKMIKEAEKCFKMVINHKKVTKKNIRAIISSQVLSNLYTSVFVNEDHFDHGENSHTMKLVKTLATQLFKNVIKDIWKNNYARSNSKM